MLIELFGKVGSLFIAFALVYIVILIITEFAKGINLGQSIKMLICMLFTIVIILSIFFILAINIYQVANIWKEYEINNVLNPRIKSVSFAAVELVWSFICVALLFLLWKFVYFHQIISGHGGIKSRLINKYKNFMKG